jgi:hypothetical protein
MKQNKLSKIELTLPVYNEEKVIVKNVQRIIEYLDANFRNNWHITIAENGSDDKTFDIANIISENNKRVSVIKTEKGRGNAIKKSWQESNADYLIYMDIDLSTQPEEISKLINALKKNSDIAIGSRFLKESKSKRTISRKIISKIYNFLANRILGLKINDLQCGFKGITKKVKFLLGEIKDSHWFFDTELLYKAKKIGIKISEVPISWDERQEEKRKSKVNIILDSATFLINIFKLKLKDKIYLQVSLIFIIFSGIMFLIIKDAPGALCPDSFYHAKIAQTIWETKSLLTNFPWLPFTILGGDKFVDHHMLYHIIASPFVGLFGFYGMKAITSILAGGLFATIYLLFKKYKINIPMLWLLTLFATPAFIYRITLYRAMPLSLILLLLGMYFITSKKYTLLLLTSFIFVWSYNAFPLLIIFSIIYALAEKIINNKFNLKPAVVVTSGIILGIIINPYFPENIDFYKIHLFIIPFLNGLSSNFSVGAEWYPLDFMETISNLTLVWIIFCISIVTLFYKRKNIINMQLETITYLIISIIFFLASVKSQRFVEYWAPFSIISGALIFKKVKFDVFLINFVKKMYKNAYLVQFLSIMIVPLTILLFVFASANSTANSTEPYQRIKPTIDWVNNNIQKDKIIINLSWDTFPELYYWNNKNYYVAGMDLMFLCSYDEKRCDIYNKLLKDKTLKDNEYLKEAKTKFKSDIIFTFKENNIYKSLKDNKNFNELYNDEYSSIFQIKDE